ncbi:hypothetical protein [Massilia violaceinigra]|uniref:hypothetical protein n=1 Tax=Massilia violaceinigra TaxID=2045208 RepID=UPI0012FD1AFA|nr:hypothetical protein [Massilia violaceinigra]
MKPYVIEYTVRTVVMGESESEAYSAALDEWREVAGDSTPDVDVSDEVHSAKDLPSGWDLQCIPYGGDGTTRLEHLICTPTEEPKP